MLYRNGVDYPEELPTLDEIDRKEETKEWLAAHNYDETEAERIYKTTNPAWKEIILEGTRIQHN